LVDPHPNTTDAQCSSRLRAVCPYSSRCVSDNWRTQFAPTRCSAQNPPHPHRKRECFFL